MTASTPATPDPRKGAVDIMRVAEKFAPEVVFLALKDQQAALASLAAELAELREAAGPMARLPYPMSSDERDDWRVYQHRLRAVLAGEDTT